MGILGIFINALGRILHTLIQIYVFVIIIATLLSWVRPDPYNPIVQIFYRLTFPLLEWLRTRLPLLFNGIDLSPLVVILGLYFLDLSLVRIMIEF